MRYVSLASAEPNRSFVRPGTAWADETVEVMKRAANGLDAAKVLDVVTNDSAALDLLDGHDHRTVGEPSAKIWSPNRNRLRRRGLSAFQ